MIPLLHYLRNFTRPFLLLIVILLFGSSGYQLLEGWTFLDSLYMTTITLTTVGFGEVRPLSPGGKIFTIVLIYTGIFLYAITVNSILQMFMEERFRDVFWKLRMEKKIKELKNHIVIAGGGRMALAIAEELEKAGQDFVFIEKNSDAIVMEYLDRWPIIHKDALLEDALVEAGVERARGLAAVLTNDSDNLFVVLTARKLNPGLSIQTRVDAESTLPIMQLAGADAIISPKRIGGQQIARSFINPEVHSFLSVVLDRAAHYEFEMKIHKVAEGDSFINNSIQEADFRENGYIIIAIRLPDGSIKFAPRATTILKKDYEVFLIGPGKTDEDNRS